MVHYLVGFRSGAQLKLKVNDGAKLVKDILSGITGSPSSQVQWYSETGLMLQVSEITYVVPITAIAEGE